MKKSLILGFLFIIILSGCTTSSDNTQVETDTNIEANVRIPDFVRPEEEAGLRGLVKNIVGNEITILEVAKQEREEDLESDEDAPAASLSTGTRIPGMGGGGGNSDLSESDRLEMLKSKSVGETKVLIPVGIKMLKNIDGEISEATLLDITNDKMLNIWLNDNVEGRNVADFVMIN